MSLRLLLALLSLSLLAVPAASAATIGFDPSDQTVSKGDSFTVDIVISDVVAPVNLFELDLVFDASVLTATAVTDGGFLPAPTIPIQNTITPGRVEYALASVSLGAIGSGVLATVSFDAVAAGKTALSLENVLVASLGTPVLVNLRDGSVAVSNPVPEPTAALVFGLGLLVVSRRVRARR